MDTKVRLKRCILCDFYIRVFVIVISWVMGIIFFKDNRRVRVDEDEFQKRTRSSCRMARIRHGV